jgi:hypothetical protein
MTLSIKYTLSLFLLVLAFSLTTIAQSHYNTTVSYGFVNNISNCHANNCFLQTNGLAGGGTGTFTQISSGYDLSVFAIDLTGVIWTLPVASSSKSLWTKTGMNDVGGTNYSAKWIAVRSAKKYTQASCPPVGRHRNFTVGTAPHGTQFWVA